MAERSEAEINLKITGDPRGADQTVDALKRVQKASEDANKAGSGASGTIKTGTLKPTGGIPGPTESTADYADRQREAMRAETRRKMAEQEKQDLANASASVKTTPPADVSRAEALKASPKTIEDLKKQIADTKAELKAAQVAGGGTPPTKPPTKGGGGAAEEPPDKKELVSPAFEALQRAQDIAQRGGGTDESLGYAARRRQEATFAAAVREQERQQKEDLRKAAENQRTHAGLIRRFEAQGTTEPLENPEDDPKIQARLFERRRQQKIRYAQLFRTAEKEAGRSLEGEDPRGPGGGGGEDGEVEGGGGRPRRGPSRGDTVGVIRFAAALGGASIGLSLFAAAGRLLRSALDDLVQAQDQELRSLKDLTGTFGSAAPAAERFVQVLGRGPEAFGVIATRQLLENLKPLQTNLRITTPQLEGLATAATKLADIRNIPLVQAANLLEAAIRGDSTAAEGLGLRLDDVSVAVAYQSGRFAASFNSLSDYEKAQARLGVALREVNRVQQDTATQSDSLERAQRRAQLAQVDLAKELSGPAYGVAKAALDTYVAGLQKLKDAIDLIKSAAPDQSFKPPSEARQQYDANIAARNKFIADQVEGIQRLAKEQEELGKVGAGQAPGAAALITAGKILANITGIATIQANIKNNAATKEETAKIDAAIEATNKMKLEAELAGSSIIDIGKAGDTAKPSLDRVFAEFNKGASAAQASINSIRGAVTNLGALNEHQIASLVQKEAEQAAVRQKQLQEQTYSQDQLRKGLKDALAGTGPGAARDALQQQLDRLNQLTDAEREFITAQQESNKLQLEAAKLAGQSAQAQLGALTQNRALQDNDLRLQRDVLVAKNQFASPAERDRARRDAYQAKLVAPALGVAAFDANAPQRAIARQEEVNSLLTRIASATESSRQYQLDIAISIGGDLVIKGNGLGLLPADQADRIAALVEGRVAQAISAARRAAENVGDPTTTFGGLRPR